MQVGAGFWDNEFTGPNDRLVTALRAFPRRWTQITVGAACALSSPPDLAVMGWVDLLDRIQSQLGALAYTL